MSKWPDCPVIACKNDGCKDRCLALKDGKAGDVLNAYVPQIIAAARADPDSAYMVKELLREYGAKAYHQGQAVLMAQISKLV